MKHKKLIIVLSIVLLLIIAAVVVGVTFFLPTYSMTPAATGKIGDTGITAIRNNTSGVYFYDTGDGYIIIDTGSDSAALLTSMNEMAINPDDIKYVFITHTDYDHMVSLNNFKNAKVYLSKNEKQMIDGTTKRNSFSNNRLPAGVSIDDMTWLENGENIEINGHTVECIDAPGHTTGSMVYLLDDKYLFTGDAFKVADNVISIHPYTMDEETAEATTSNLKPVFDRSELILTSHYGYYKPDEIK